MSISPSNRYAPRGPGAAWDEAVAKPQPSTLSSQTGRDLWRRQAESGAADPFLQYGERTWTYGEADAEMRRAAASLSALGVTAGTRVLVGMSNRAETVFIHMALRELGAVLVALVPGLQFDQLAFQVRHSEGEMLIVDDSIAELLLPRIHEFPGVGRVVADGPPARTARRGAELAELFTSDPLPLDSSADVTDMSASAILYTSGSTSAPKGVVLPAGAFFSGGLGYVERFGFTADDNYLLPMTLAHGLGALLAQSIAMQAGGQLTVTDRFSPSSFWSDVERHQATFTLLCPGQLNLLLKVGEGAPPAATSLRFVISHAWHAGFRERFGVELGTVWGSTETGTVGVGSPAEYRGEHADDGYLGLPLPASTELEIRDADGNARHEGKAGEIWLHHPHIMLEYLKEPELTADTVRDGWVRTGDRGSLDADGRLHFRGRIKSMIKRSGENISIEEVEVTLHEHPQVVECIAFGVADPMRTEELAVVAMVKDGADRVVTGSELSAFVAGRLARFKAPRYVLTMVDALPRLGSGKVDRAGIANAFDGGAYWDRDHDRGG
jgi:acyl-CoA synthetase (AMP-forming)/AMP-acid ligase II